MKQESLDLLRRNLLSESKAKNKNSFINRLIINRWCYLFILPLIVMYSGFTLWPVLASGYFALFDWNGIGWPTKFIGLGNFVKLIKDPYFWNAFRNTYVFALIQTAIKLPVALLLAILLNNPRLKGATFYRTIYFLPVVTTTAIIGILFTFILNPYSGALNNVLIRLRMIKQPIDWLGVGDLAFIMVIVVGAWQRIGQYMIYWLAGLQSIPEELYEAARIDGAKAVQLFRHITVPLIKPIGAIILVIGFVNSLRVFDLVMTMTGGGPNFATDMMGTYVYRNAFSNEFGPPQMSYAAAAGLLFGFSLIVVAILQQSITKKVKDARQH
ncbi:MAG: sugar ABC transporter permease [Firmicutes bacterium]|nr:sugar ABC transporter permease [Bacillota bacterium]